MKHERINLTPGYCRDLKAKDKKYFDTYRPDQLANFIYNDYQ